MWVIKIGGSLHGDAALARWLDVIAQLGGGRIVVVAGGGAFADQVRTAQSRWRFDDLTAHNMALLAMAQSAQMLRALQPSLRVAAGERELRDVLRHGRAALWMPLDLIREAPDASTNWGITADSLALGLAKRLGAERLMLVKSCRVDAAASLSALGAQGVLDAAFALLAVGATFPIEVLHKGEVERLRESLGAQ